MRRKNNINETVVIGQLSHIILNWTEKSWRKKTTCEVLISSSPPVKHFYISLRYTQIGGALGVKERFAKNEIHLDLFHRSLECSCWLSSNTNTHSESCEESSIQQNLTDDKERTKAHSNIDMLNTWTHWNA